MLPVFAHSVWYWLLVSHRRLIILKYVSPMPSLVNVFTIRDVEFYQRLCYIYSDDNMPLFLILFMWWITFINLHMLNQPGIPVIMQAFLILVNYLFDALLDSTCRCLLRIFSFMFIMNVDLYFLFSSCLCQVLVWKWWLHKMN